MINQGCVLVTTEKSQKNKSVDLLNWEMDGERSAVGTNH